VVFNHTYQQRARRQGRPWTDRLYGLADLGGSPPRCWGIRKRDQRDRAPKQLELFPADTLRTPYTKVMMCSSPPHPIINSWGLRNECGNLAA
jgi:hypothetical protein